MHIAGATMRHAAGLAPLAVGAIWGSNGTQMLLLSRMALMASGPVTQRFAAPAVLTTLVTL